MPCAVTDEACEMAEKLRLSDVRLRKPGTIFLAAALGVCLFLAALMLRSFWSAIILAVVIGIGSYPLYLKISKLVKRRNWSAFLSVIAVTVILLVPLILFSSIASSEIVRAGQRIRANPELMRSLMHPTDRAINWIAKYVDVERTGIRSAIDSLPLKASQTMISVAKGVITGLLNFVGQAIITLFILFFVFRDGPATLKWISSLAPLHRERVMQLFTMVKEGVIANFYGILVVALIQGVLTGVGFAIVRLPSPILFGVAAALCSVIPFFGTAVVSLPASIFLLATGHWVKGMFLLGWGVAVVGTSDNIVLPLVVMQRVRLHPLILLFALLGGAQQFGFAGLFIGPAVMSVIAALFHLLQDKSVGIADEIEHISAREATSSG